MCSLVSCGLFTALDVRTKMVSFCDFVYIGHGPRNGTDGRRLSSSLFRETGKEQWIYGVSTPATASPGKLLRMFRFLSRTVSRYLKHIPKMMRNSSSMKLLCMVTCDIFCEIAR